MSSNLRLSLGFATSLLNVTMLNVTLLGVTAFVSSLVAQTPARGNAPNAANARATATFPAQQRPPGNPVLIAHGRTLYDVDCRKCHGADLRGAGPGGISLLRSQIVLSDNEGELMKPLIEGSRKSEGMPAINMTAVDIRALATYIHSVVATEKGQGAPPAPGIEAPSALVGDAAAGKVFFAAKCAACHSETGDLRGYATKYPDAKTAQNFWVSGRGAGRRRGPAAGAPDPRAITVTVTLPSGEAVQGELLLVDDFLVSLTQPDGTVRTFRRDGDEPRVEIKDPMQAHKTLLDTMNNKDMHDVTAYLETLK